MIPPPPPPPHRVCSQFRYARRFRISPGVSQAPDFFFRVISPLMAKQSAVSLKAVKVPMPFSAGFFESSWASFVCDAPARYLGRVSVPPFPSRRAFHSVPQESLFPPPAFFPRSEMCRSRLGNPCSLAFQFYPTPPSFWSSFIFSTVVLPRYLFHRVRTRATIPAGPGKSGSPSAFFTFWSFPFLFS